MTRLVLFVVLAMVGIATCAEAVKKYPKPGVNCARKHDRCMAACPPPNYGSATSINQHNECLNNCVIDYDLCLGKPQARQLDGDLPQLQKQ